jgi:hypothetical protein
VRDGVENQPHPVKDQNGENLLRDSNKGRNLGVETQSFTETLEMVDANNLSKYSETLLVIVYVLIRQLKWIAT